MGAPKTSATFFIGLMIIILIPYFLIKEGIKAAYPKITNIVNHSVDTNIAVFGSSVALVHFDPAVISRMTGRQVYNFGLNGTPLIEYRGLLEEFIEYSDCEVVVIAGTISEFEERSALYNFSKYTPHLKNDNLYAALSEIDPPLLWKSRYVPLYDLTTYKADTYISALKALKDKALRDNLDKLQGYSPKKMAWEESTENNIVSVDVDEDALSFYRGVIKAANKRGKRVVLVLTPVYEEGQKKVINIHDVKDAYRSLVGAGGGDNIFLDFTTSEICEDKSLFYNNTHLNNEGASLFSEQFSRRLLKERFVPNIDTCSESISFITN